MGGCKVCVPGWKCAKDHSKSLTIQRRPRFVYFVMGLSNSRLDTYQEENFRKLVDLVSQLISGKQDQLLVLAIVHVSRPLL